MNECTNDDMESKVSGTVIIIRKPLHYNRYISY